MAIEKINKIIEIMVIDEIQEQFTFALYVDVAQSSAEDLNDALVRIAEKVTESAQIAPNK